MVTLITCYELSVLWEKASLSHFIVHGQAIYRYDVLYHDLTTPILNAMSATRSMNKEIPAA